MIAPNILRPGSMKVASESGHIHDCVRKIRSAIGIGSCYCSSILLVDVVEPAIVSKEVANSIALTGSGVDLP